MVRWAEVLFCQTTKHSKFSKYNKKVSWFRNMFAKIAWQESKSTRKKTIIISNVVFRRTPSISTTKRWLCSRCVIHLSNKHVFYIVEQKKTSRYWATATTTSTVGSVFHSCIFYFETTTPRFNNDLIENVNVSSNKMHHSKTYHEFDGCDAWRHGRTNKEENFAIDKKHF